MKNVKILFRRRALLDLHEDVILDVVHKSRAKRGPIQRFLLTVGLVCVLVGVSLLGYVGWQYYGTNIIAKQKQQEITQTLITNWDDGIDGNAIGLLRIPRFGDAYEVPIVPGFDDEALASGVGWYEDGAEPGEIGNFSIAGHRVTHGEPFRDFLKLRKGDKIVVETRTHIFTYKLRDNGTDRVLDFTEGWVLDPVPGKSGVEPTEPMLTMLTCSELFHTRNRNVVFGDLVDTQRKVART